METRTTAKATPARATRKRAFSCVSWSHARGTRRRREMAMSSGLDHDVDPRVAESRRELGLQQPDAHLDDARVHVGHRVGAERVLLPHLEPDPLHHPAELAPESGAPDPGALAGMHPSDVGLVDLGHRVHACGVADLRDALGSHALSLAGVDLEDLTVDGRADGRELELGPGALETRAGDVAGQLEGLPVRLGEHPAAAQLGVALDLALGVRQLGAQPGDLRSLDADARQGRELLAPVNPVAFLDEQALYDHGRPG